MNRFTSTLAWAALATTLSAGTALAGGGQKSDATQVVPSRGDAQTQSQPQSQMQSQGQSQGTRGGAAASGGVRDWAAIDTNSNNLIEPAEMEVALKEVGPQAKSK